MRPERVLLLLSLLLAAVAISSPLWWRYGAPDLFFVNSVAVGLSLIAGGYLCSRWRSGRAIARLMFVAACLYFLPFIGYGHNPILFSISFIFDGLWIPVAAHFFIAFPEGRLRSRAERVTVGFGYAWTLLLSTSVLFYDPAAFGDANVPTNAFLVTSLPALLTAMNGIGLLVSLLVGLAVLWLVIRRWRTATPPERRVISPVFLALALVVITTVPATIASALYQAGTLPAVAFEVALLIERTSVLLLPISFGIGIARGVLARSSVGNLMVRIGQGRSAPEIERDVAWALSDPSARLAVRSSATAAFVDASGHPVPVDTLPASSVRIIEGSGGASVALIHDPSLERDQPELLDSVASATRLALDNQRLEAEASLNSQLPLGLAERLQREGNRIGDTKTLNISVLMSDIRGYSTLAERADLHDLAAQLNEHRAQMNRIITAAGGTVMQFVGDMVFAVFGAPEPTADHARKAVQAAIEMQATQAEINAAWAKAGRPPFGLGIAVTTGDVAAALLGSIEHVEYSVVGDVVNLAQRLQGWAAAGEVVINDSTREQIGSDPPTTQLPTATVKGRQAPVTAYKLAPA